jgi:integrase
MLLRKTLCEETEQCSDCGSMWIATLGSRGLETRSVAIEGEPLGHSRFGGQGRTDTNRACAELVQGACRCLAPRFGVSEGKVFRRVLKNGPRQDAGVTANVAWYAVKRCAKRAGIGNLAPHDIRRSCARLCHGCGGELEQIHSAKQSMIDSKSQWHAMRFKEVGS